ncbi:hypothetical protein EV401DRAFT_805386 [Pisolithus croceorrhizus]|nr:hypothetical protein EV401DRAFT_805386 [Pisolithus croceorrhizus]
MEVVVWLCWRASNVHSALLYALAGTRRSRTCPVVDGKPLSHRQASLSQSSPQTKLSNASLGRNGHHCDVHAWPQSTSQFDANSGWSISWCTEEVVAVFWVQGTTEWRISTCFHIRTCFGH